MQDAVTPLSETEAIDLVKTCFASATERDIYTVSLSNFYLSFVIVLYKCRNFDVGWKQCSTILRALHKEFFDVKFLLELFLGLVIWLPNSWILSSFN